MGSQNYIGPALDHAADHRANLTVRLASPAAPLGMTEGWAPASRKAPGKLAP
jgi:hypothetical protein